jgi:hypothetical protein
MTYAKRPSRRAAVGSVTAALVSIAVMAANVSAGLLGIARDDRYSTAFETRLVVAEPGVLANDVDIGSNATAELTDDVAHGIVALEEDGSFEYEPDDGFAGTDRFDYRVANSVTGLLLSATVTITVAPAPATPTPTPAPTAPPTRRCRSRRSICRSRRRTCRCQHLRSRHRRDLRGPACRRRRPCHRPRVRARRRPRPRRAWPPAGRRGPVLREEATVPVARALVWTWLARGTAPVRAPA